MKVPWRSLESCVQNLNTAHRVALRRLGRLGDQATHVLAADYGAGSGRVVRGSFDGSKLSLQEVHRFNNEPVQLGADCIGISCDFFMN